MTGSCYRAPVSFRVLASSALPFDIRPILGPEVEYWQPAAGHLERGELLRALAGAEALIALLTDAVDEELLAAAPRLRVVANFAVGHDNVDLAAASRRGVAVTNTPDVLTDATADLAFALLLAAARRLGEGERLVRSGSWTGWEPGQLLGADVSGRTLGLIGMGRIGRAVARRAAGFAMPILYSAPRPLPSGELPAARHVSLDELLASADFVSLHCPLTAATRHLIDAGALARMRPGAVLVNTARGACVDEAALAAALRTGHLAAAGLDVFAAEPAVHPALLASERVFLAPHIGSATTTARRRMAEICAGAVRAVVDGRRPATLLNPESMGPESMGPESMGPESMGPESMGPEVVA